VLLYLESQLNQAYLVFVNAIPVGEKVPNVEEFRCAVELDEEWFEDLLIEYEENEEKYRKH
tara:strand:+ start:343 stop:525 length:183 start_codon:yes stop_codon:yes gene_type:complete